MLLGIVGDVIGSIYEGHQWQKKDLDLFSPVYGNPQIKALLKNINWVRKDNSWTDDTLCTLALYSSFINNIPPKESLLYFCKKYINQTIGFSKSFTSWLNNPVPYEGYTNGCLMRIGFIPYLKISIEEKLLLGKKCTEISHNHTESFLAVKDFILLSEEIKIGNKECLKKYLITHNFNKTIEQLHIEAKFEMKAMPTLLQAVLIVEKSFSIEEILRNCFYIGGDTDTLACIACNLASSIYECPKELMAFSLKKLEPYEDLNKLVNHFKDNFGTN